MDTSYLQKIEKSKWNNMNSEEKLALIESHFKNDQLVIGRIEKDYTIGLEEIDHSLEGKNRITKVDMHNYIIYKFDKELDQALRNAKDNLAREAEIILDAAYHDCLTVLIRRWSERGFLIAAGHFDGITTITVRW